MNYQESYSVVTDFIEKLVAQMEEHIKQKYEIGIDFKIDVHTSASTSRRFSWGGTKKGNPYIKMLCSRYIKGYMEGTLVNEIEYKHIENDPIIGSLKNVPWQQACASLVAHEVAHAVQYFPQTKSAAKRELGIECLDDRAEILRGHDWFWQRIYTDLRIKFVNDPTDLLNMKINTAHKIPKNKKSWYSKSLAKSGGIYYYYYRTSDSELIGEFFRRPNSYVQKWDSQSGNWVITEFTSVTKARQELLGL